MNRESVRSPARSLANNEFHEAGDHITTTSLMIARRLEDIGIRAMNEPVAFPMEADRLTAFPSLGFVTPDVVAKKTLEALGKRVTVRPGFLSVF